MYILKTSKQLWNRIYLKEKFFIEKLYCIILLYFRKQSEVSNVQKWENTEK